MLNGNVAKGRRWRKDVDREGVLVGSRELKDEYDVYRESQLRSSKYREKKICR